MTKSWKLALLLQTAIAGVAIVEMDTRHTDVTTTDRKTDVRTDVKTKESIDVSHIRASKLIGMEVYNREDKHLGEIHDIVLDRSLKHVGYAVLSYGGIAGMGDKLFAIPYRNIEFGSGTMATRAYLPLDINVLKNAPGFDQKNWPQEANADYFQKLDTYYSTNRAGDRPMSSMRDNMKDMGQDLKDSSRDLKNEAYDRDARPAAGTMDRDRNLDKGLVWDRRVSNLIGVNVEDPAGKNLGEIKDLVIDWKGGDVQYAVLSFGGILGMGDKLFAIPIDRFQAKADSEKFVLNVDREQLKNAPGFNKDSWPSMADPSWDKDVRGYYDRSGTVIK